MGRGPSYPYTDLEGAIAYTRKVYDYVKRGSAAVEAVVKDGLKLSPTSSGSQKVIAALRSFGLIEDAQGGNSKGVKLSARSIRILLDDLDSQERQDELKKAALAPKWYEYCWSKWGKDMPPAMRSNLLIEHGFVESTVDGFLNDYRKTIAFAGLLDDVIFNPNQQSIDESKNRPKIGEYVQYELNGVLQMPEARKLLRIESTGEKGDFGVVEGYLGGIPYKDLILADAPEPEPKPKTPTFAPAMTPPLKGDVKMQTESFSLSNGLSAQVQWPSVISAAEFKRFEYFLTGIKMSVEEAVNKPEVQSQKDEKASEEGMERSG
jgi:hypothetical protein